MLIFFENKNADISKIKGILALKGIFSETKYLCVLYVPNFKALKSTPRLGLRTSSAKVTKSAVTYH